MIMENIESELPNIVYAFDNSECQTGGHLLLDPTPFYMLSALVSRCLTACESSQQYNAVRSIMKTSINIYGPVTSDSPPEAATVTTTCSQPARRSPSSPRLAVCRRRPPCRDESGFTGYGGTRSTGGTPFTRRSPKRQSQ